MVHANVEEGVSLMGSAELSGHEWWRANQARFPNSRDIVDLEPTFGEDVARFIRSLRQAGADVRVRSTRRSAARAYLMHYSWKVAYGEVAPDEVPTFSGVRIIWDHGDAKASQAAAREMVNLFGMVHVAALKSNHIVGKAIDMDVSWKGSLSLSASGPGQTPIDSTPRSGQNKELHEIATTVFRVRKLASDPPHWSSNGK